MHRVLRCFVLLCSYQQLLMIRLIYVRIFFGVASLWTGQTCMNSPLPVNSTWMLWVEMPSQNHNKTVKREPSARFLGVLSVNLKHIRFFYLCGSTFRFNDISKTGIKLPEFQSNNWVKLAASLLVKTDVSQSDLRKVIAQLCFIRYWVKSGNKWYPL